MWNAGPGHIAASFATPPFFRRLLTSSVILSMSNELKTPKGTRDYGPFEMAIREQVFATITQVFKRHGAVTIDTPVFELRDVLMGKYGEESKLIYDLADQGGEICSLRYDLTVPFARFLAMNKGVKLPLKRYHIAKVYRRDQPALTKGRYREFYQCDFDVAGANMEAMLPDAEVIKIIVEALKALNIGSFKVKVNNRKLLDGLFEACGVPEEKFRAICSAVDKLDKSPWTEIRKEMITAKGLDDKIADKIGEYVLLSGGVELLERLLDDDKLKANIRAMEGLNELKTLFDFLALYQVTPYVSFDFSLARGLDYYTGMILEAVLTDSSSEVGSIAGGGRYDTLVGMFSKNDQPIPCVGASLGVERIFSILEARALKSVDQPRSSPTQVLVAAAGEDFLSERIALCNQLWAAGFNAEILMKRKVKALDQFSFCEKMGIPYAIILGPEEYRKELIKIRCIADRSERLVAKDELLCELKKLFENKASLEEQITKLTF